MAELEFMLEIAIQIAAKKQLPGFAKPMTDDAIYQRSDSALSTDIKGSAMLMSMDSGDYFELEATGARIWDLLEHPTSLAEICASLHARYAVSEEQCRQEAGRFLDQLLALGLVIRQ